MIKAIIFDFDGLIIDTETAMYNSWNDTYKRYGCSLPLSKWEKSVGSFNPLFNPYEYLSELLEKKIDKETVRCERRSRFAELLKNIDLLPGVKDYILKSKELGLKLAIASSSSKEWVVTYLEKFKIDFYFDTIICSDHVKQIKPFPDIYQMVLAQLNISNTEAIALEDSPNGCLSAKQAGIYCVAIPNNLTKHFSFGNADLQINSLYEVPLNKLLIMID